MHNKLTQNKWCVYDFLSIKVFCRTKTGKTGCSINLQKTNLSTFGDFSPLCDLDCKMKSGSDRMQKII